MLVNPFSRWRTLRTLRRHAIPFEDWRQVSRTPPLFAGLQSVERAQLRKFATLFLARKTFTGANGFQVTDRVRRTIAVQACLLVLHLGLDAYDGWVEIVVYPSRFRADHQHQDAAGVVHRRTRVLSGESWSHEPLLLSWDEVLLDLHDPQPGYNVAVHEFAHKLDMGNGAANGMPPLAIGMPVERWTTVMREAFDDLGRKTTGGCADTPLDPYAASDPAEFFAVATEYFFSAPHLLQQIYPGVYGQLVCYYRQDPAIRMPCPCRPAPIKAPEPTGPVS